MTEDMSKPLTQHEREVFGGAFKEPGMIVEAATTRGSRNPNTLAHHSPVAAYNLGWQEARDQMRLSGWQDDKDWGPIPRYAMLDIWMAVYGSEASQEFDTFANEHGYAETWARLCSIVREGENKIEADFAEQITQAEEPIEDRLRRAWLNGFREGMERSAYIERRWDHS